MRIRLTDSKIGFNPNTVLRVVFVIIALGLSIVQIAWDVLSITNPPTNVSIIAVAIAIAIHVLSPPLPELIIFFY